VEAVATAALRDSLRVVVAESLTSGALAARLGAGPDAATWFGGGLVAYQEVVKFGLLGVEEGPVVTEACAEQMARGATSLFKADVAVSVTGVGGPGPSEGKPPGTVFVSVVTTEDQVTRELHLDGEPAAVIEQTCEAAISLLAQLLGASGGPGRAEGS
jgi:nicotinamide-nucleotide amidase